jgi:hypothetical protein
MITTNDFQALAWKYDFEQGMRFKQDESGSIEVTGWPDSLPSLTQSLVDQAEADYTAHLSTERDQTELADLKLKAENAELRIMIDIDTGTTPEAVAYQLKKSNLN